METVSKSRKLLIGTSMVLIVLLAVVVIFAMFDKNNQSWTSAFGSAKDNYDKGYELSQQNNYAEAVKYLQNAVNKDSSNREYQKELAVAEYNLKNYDAAIAAYNKILATNSKDAFSYNGIANVYRDKNDLEKAIEYYKKAVEANPQFAVTYNNYALVLTDLGKKQEAINILQDGIKANPNSDELKNSLSNLQK